jgi:general secretion pathway protein J
VKKQRGFTLIEILVASAISAILAVMAFSAMTQAVQNRDRVRAAQARLIAVQFTVRTLVQDFSQLAPRPIRVPVGEGYDAALTAQAGAANGVVLTRSGWSNPAGVQRSNLQRVRYQLREGVLYRDFWTVLDAQPDPLPVPRPLLEGVTAFSLRFMTDGRQWRDDWPPPQPNAAAQLRFLRWRPIAVEVTLTLQDWGTIRRVIEVAG